MMRTLFLAAAISAFGLPAFAEKDADVLASCMVANSTESQTANMKELIIHALQENKPQASEAFLKVSFEALSIATQKCGLSFADMQTPKFEDAIKSYGETLGEKIMVDALALLDLPIN